MSDNNLETSDRRTGAQVRVPGWLKVQLRAIAAQPGPYFEYRNFKGDLVRVHRRPGLSGQRALEILRAIK